MKFQIYHRPIYYLFLLIPIYSGSVKATSIDTSLFSLEIPDQLRVQDNKTSIIIAAGDKVVDGTPLPFLSIQYCVNGNPSKSSKFRLCNKSCSEAAKNLTNNAKLKDAQFSPIEMITKPNGIFEYSTELTSVENMAALITLSCSDVGQIHLSLVSEPPKDIVKQLFADVLKSLKWKLDFINSP